MAQIFSEIKLGDQKVYSSVPFPSVVSPIAGDGLSLASVTHSITTHKPYLESLLHRSGALLFRGFPLTTASDFNDVVQAFGFEELPYVGVAPRTKVVGKVFTANESPPDHNIPFHHEMALVAQSPSKLFFFCEVEPGSGGETPIVLSHIVYERMKLRYPEFVERLEEHGLIYTRIVRDDDDPSSPIGRGWKSIFSTQDKNVAQERAAQLGMRLEWMEGGAKTVKGPIPGIKYDIGRKRKIWFNSLAVACTSWKDNRGDPVTFGDGKPLPADVICECVKIMEEECVAIPWQKGDVMLLDNLAVLHSRRSCNPPRSVLASLCK